MIDEQIKEQAIEFAKKNKLKIAKEIASFDVYKPEVTPISVFMAGSPGAGKTEFSKELIRILESDGTERRVIRIDADEIRPILPGYTGNNSYLFQYPVSLVVEKVHDLALHNKQSFILDTTFANPEKARYNVGRSLDKERPVYIFYLYQKPEVAWKFTKAREEIEGRQIPRQAFIEEFVGAREAINAMLEKYNDNITVFLVVKDFEKNTVNDIIPILGGGVNVDEYLPKVYSRDELDKIIL